LINRRLDFEGGGGDEDDDGGTFGAAPRALPGADTVARDVF
jgi:hypothetical protein